MLVHWIWLSTRRGISARGVQALLGQFENAGDLYRANAETLSHLNLNQKVLDALLDKDLGYAYKIQRQCAGQNIHILTWQDAAYPPALRSIPDPPVVLYCLGNLPDLDEAPGIAVVGTRSFTAYGVETAGRLGFQIAGCGGIVVSGLAKGIDAAAMRGALEAGGPVIGVLGCGVDVVYPKENASLFTKTAERGCLISEYPPGTPPLGRHFPVRNRIISGLCRGVLVVEAPEGSGALITAENAADQGRDLFVVPGNIDVAACAGSNRLLREGAIAVSSGWDVVSEYAAQYPGKLHEGPVSDIPPKAAPAPAPKAPAAKKPEFVPLPADLSPAEQAVAAALRSGPLPMDTLVLKLGTPPAAVMAALTMLEIKGIAQRLPGNRAALK